MNSEHKAFHEMRRKNRKLTKEQALEILGREEYGILSTVGEDGYPYGIPVNYVYSDHKLYFHCALDAGHKVENIRYCPQVCFTVVGENQIVPKNLTTKYESVVVFGRATEVVEEKRQILDNLAKRFSAEYPEEGRNMIENCAEVTGVYEISMESISGKANRE